MAKNFPCRYSREKQIHFSFRIIARPSPTEPKFTEEKRFNEEFISYY